MWPNLPDPKSPFFDQDLRRVRRHLLRQHIATGWGNVCSRAATIASLLLFRVRAPFQ
jgi:hypothetical protein